MSPNPRSIHRNVNKWKGKESKQRLLFHYICNGEMVVLLIQALPGNKRQQNEHDIIRALTGMLTTLSLWKEEDKEHYDLCCYLPLMCLNIKESL